jgi:hypothetical protein
MATSAYPEGDITRMADDLRADLDQLLSQRRHRPVLDRLRRRQVSQEVAEVVGQRVKLKTRGVGRERRLGALLTPNEVSDRLYM